MAASLDAFQSSYIIDDDDDEEEEEEEEEERKLTLAHTTQGLKNERGEPRFLGQNTDFYIYLFCSSTTPSYPFNLSRPKDKPFRRNYWSRSNLDGWKNGLSLNNESIFMSYFIVQLQNRIATNGIRELGAAES